MMFWVVRETSHRSRRDGSLAIREQRLEAYETREDAEKAARFYRREYRRRVYVEHDVDVRVYGGGTLYRLFAVSQQAKDWVEENVSPEGYNPHYPAVLNVEHRYIDDLIEGMTAAGLTVE